VLLHVVPRIPVAGRDSGGVLRLEGQEGDRYLMPEVVVGVVAEVREVFSLCNYSAGFGAVPLEGEGRR